MTVRCRHPECGRIVPDRLAEENHWNSARHLYDRTQRYCAPCNTLYRDFAALIAHFKSFHLRTWCQRCEDLIINPQFLYKHRLRSDHPDFLRAYPYTPPTPATPAPRTTTSSTQSTQSTQQRASGSSTSTAPPTRAPTNSSSASTPAPASAPATSSTATPVKSSTPAKKDEAPTPHPPLSSYTISAIVQLIKSMHLHPSQQTKLGSELMKELNVRPCSACCICLDDLEKEAKALECGHLFCTTCVNGIRDNCPQCRAKITKPALRVYL